MILATNKGSNDLNMLLKTQVIKIRAELDVPNSMPKIKKQVGEISERLDKANKRVKIKVELDATIKNLQKQFKDIQTKITGSNSVKPIKLQVQIDVAGSAKNIKKQLQDVYKTVQDFNKQYGEQIKKMQQQTQQMNSSANKGTKQTSNLNPIGGFDYKLYAQQIKDAEKLLRDTFSPKTGKGLFSSFEFRDAQGNLQGFIGQLEKANGVVHKIRYEWNAQAGAFTPINQQTINTMEKHIHKASQSLRSLYSDIEKLNNGSGKNALFSQYNDLEKRIGHNTLTQDAVKQLQQMIKQEQVLQQQVEKGNKDYYARQELMRQIKKMMNVEYKKSGDFEQYRQYKQFLMEVKSGTKPLEQQRLEFRRMNDEIQKAVLKEKELQANTKKRMQTLQELRRINSSTVSSDKDSQALIREIRLMAQRATTAKEWIAITDKMNTLKNGNAREAMQQKSIDLQFKIERKMRELADLTSKTDEKLQRDLASISKTAQRGYADLERMYQSISRSITRIKADNKRDADASKILMSNTANAGKMTQIRSAIDRHDITSLQQYIGEIYKGKVETLNLERTTDSYGRAVDRLNVKMAGAGKTVRTYTVDLDRANNTLRQTEQGSAYNANRNLGIMEQMRIALARVPVWMGAMTVFYGSIRAVREMAQEILAVDKSLTELKRVANSGINIDYIFTNAVEMSKQLGNNVHDVMQTMNEFARTFGDFNERQLLAITRTATLMSNVSELTAQEAGDSLVGTMNAFNITAEESIRIVDAFNEVDNNFAVSTKQLAEGMSKTASTAETFGVSMEQSIGHITAISSVTMESGKVIGNSLKTIYSRITTMDDAKEILEGVGVGLNDIQGNVRPVNDILSELASKWGGLSDSQRQNIAVTVAGRYQLSRFLALMNNWQTATDATATALTSQGSAMRENDRYLKSFEARINELKNGFTELALAVGDKVLSGSMLLLIEGLQSLAKFAVNVASTVGVLPTVFTALFLVMNKFGVFNKLKDSIKGAIAQLVLFRTAQTASLAGGAGHIASLRAGWNALTVAEAEAGAGARAFGWSLKGALISTGIGAIIVALGFAIEKLISYFQKQKQIAEETEKANKKLVDAYRNTEGGLDALVSKYNKLQEAVDNGSIKEGTEQWNEYLKVNKEIANALPTMVKYVDSNGVAHMESANAMKEEVKIAKELSKAQAELTVEQYDKNIDKRIGKIKDLAKEVEKLAKKQKDLKEQDGKVQSMYTGDAMGGAYTYVADNKEAIQKTKIEAIQAYQEIQKQVQGMTLQIRDTVRASLEAQGALKGMTDTQIGAVEKVVTQNEKHLMAIVDSFRKGKITQDEMQKQLEKATQDLYSTSEKVGLMISKKSNELIKSATDGITDDVEIKKKTKEIKTEFDNLLKSLPKTFFSLDSLSNADDFKKRLEGVLNIANQIKGGNGDFSGLEGQLRNLNFTQDEAKNIVAQLGFQYDNASIKAEALKQKEEGLIETTQGFIDVALEATDASQNLFGYKDDDISALTTHIETLQSLKLVYKDNASQSEAWKASIEKVSWYLGVEEEQVAKNLGYYHNVLEMLPNLKLKYDELGNATGFDTEQLNANQKAIVEKLIANGQEGRILDILTGKVSDMTGKTIDDTKAKEDNKQKSEENAQAKQKEADATNALADKFAILKGQMNEANKAIYIDTIRQQLEDFDGKINVTKDNAGNLKLVMADGSNSSYLQTLQKQLEDLGIKVGLTKDEAGNLKLTLNDGTGSQTLTQIKTGADDAKLALDNTITSADILSQKQILPNDFRQINFVDLASGMDTAFQKVQLLSGALQGTAENIVSAYQKAEEFAKKVQNIATTSDTILNNATSFAVVRDEVDKLILSLMTAQEKMGGIFNGLHISDEVAGSIANARDRINEITISASVASGSVGGFANTLSIISSVSATGVGSVAEYSHQLALLSNNLVLASQYGQGTIGMVQQLTSTFANAISIVNALNVALQNAGTGVGDAFASMASAVLAYTSLMIAEYAKNAMAMQQMRNMIETQMQQVVSVLALKGTLAVSVMDTVTNLMYDEFKSGMDSIVSVASGLPKRIGDAIRKNMGEASSAMDAVAKDMVKRFKKELGIHSPSKEFEKLGGYVIKGLANGLTGEDLKSLGKSVFEDFGGGVFDSMDMIKAYIQAGSFTGGGNLDQWLMSAIGATGVDASWLPMLRTMAMKESGGNPKAINLWDSNAKKGIPSKGLMQTIDPTFNAYKLAGFNDIYNPVHNAIASIRYILARYGSIYNTPGARSMARGGGWKGYANGGIVNRPELAWHGEEGQEAIIPLIAKRRKRGIQLWMEAGSKLGINPAIMEYLLPKQKGNGGVGSSNTGGFGASSGEGGSGEGGSGGTGTSGVMQESIYTGGMNADGGYMFNVFEMADPYKFSQNEREMTIYGGNISHLQARMSAMTKTTLEYRNALKETIYWQNKNLAVEQKELAYWNQRQASIELRLTQLPALSNQTEAQREEWNGLQQELDTALGKISSLKSEIANTENDIRAKSVEIFTSMIDELVTAYDKAIAEINKKTEDIQFKLDVLELTNPDNVEEQLKLLAEKARKLQEAEQTSNNKRADLESKYNEAVSKYGAGSEQAQKVKDDLDNAVKAWQDAVLKALQAEKEISDTRGKIADDGISKLRDYYGNMKDMALKAIEFEKKELQKSHDAKMKMYDDEISKINSIYDTKLKQMDEEKSLAEYQAGLDEKNLQRTELLNKISLLSRDTSIEGRNKVAELKQQLSDLDKDIAKMQQDHADELLKQQIEAQKQAQIDALNAQKEIETVNFDNQNAKLDSEGDAIAKHYDDLLNNDEYWANMRNEFIKGSFGQLITELENMSRTLNDLNQGNFDSLTQGFVNFSNEVKRQFAELNQLTVDNMVYANGSVIDKVYQTGNTSYNPYTGSGTNYDYGTETTWNEPTPPPAPVPPPPPPAPAQRYHTVVRGDTLWDLAQRYYGNPYKWTTIANANANPDPRKLQIGRNLLIPFRSGGYTGEWTGDEGKIAILHKKELVLNEGQTSDILNTAKLMDKIKNVIPAVKSPSLASKLATASSVITNITYGDINVTVENGDKKKARDIASEIVTGLKKRGK